MRLPCAHYPNCFGCPLIGTAYGEQLVRKGEIVATAFAAYPSLAHVEIPEVVGSPRAFGYRNQAKLVARQGRRGLQHVAALVERFAVPIYDEREQTGMLRYVIVRTSLWNKSVQVILVTKSRGLPRQGDFVRALRRVRGVVSIVLNVNRDPGNAIFGSEFIPLTKDDGLVEKIGGLRLWTRAGAFLQANPNIAGRIYRQALEWAELGSDQVAVDLYCGAGALTLHLAAAAHTAFGIEASPIAVVDAKRNARMNGISNTRFQAGDAGAMLPAIAAAVEPAVITLNPPRKGVDDATREAIVACGPARLVYVSCNPATLARDLDWFAARGYRVDAFRAYDMMPQTEHVECVARAVRES